MEYWHAKLQSYFLSQFKPLVKRESLLMNERDSNPRPPDRLFKIPKYYQNVLRILLRCRSRIRTEVLRRQFFGPYRVACSKCLERYSDYVNFILNII